MIHRRRPWLLAEFCLLLTAAWVCHAQYREGRQRTVRSLDITGIEFQEVLPPNYNPEGVFERGREDHWLRIRLEYELAGDDDDWVDELALEWFVAITPDDEPPLLLRTTVRYADVQGNDDHYAVVYVRPNILLRYYGDDTVSDNDILVDLRLQINGEAAGIFRYNDEDAPDDWWQMREPNVVVREEELLARTLTPFAPLDDGALEYIVSPR